MYTFHWAGQSVQRWWMEMHCITEEMPPVAFSARFWQLWIWRRCVSPTCIALASLWRPKYRWELPSARNVTMKNEKTQRLACEFSFGSLGLWILSWCWVLSKYSVSQKLLMQMRAAHPTQAAWQNSQKLTKLKHNCHCHHNHHHHGVAMKDCDVFNYHSDGSMVSCLLMRIAEKSVFKWQLS